MTAPSNLRGILCIVAACLFFICCDSFLKLMLEGNIPPLQTLFLRGVSASLCGFILVFALGHGGDIKHVMNRWVMLRSFAECVSVVCFIQALAKVPIADITAIYQISPLVVLIAASFLWGEHVGPLRWALIALGLVGALLVAQPGGQGTSPYALLGFVIAFTSAIRDVITRKVPAFVPGPINTLSVVVMVMLTGLVLTLAFETWQPVTLPVAAYAGAAGFFVMIAHLFIFLSFRLAPARAVAPFYYTLSLFAVFSGLMFFGETPNLLALAGIALIITCGLGVLALENRKGRDT